MCAQRSVRPGLLQWRTWAACRAYVIICLNKFDLVLEEKTMAENGKKPVNEENNSAMLKIFDKIAQNAKSSENDTENKNEKMVNE